MHSDSNTSTPSALDTQIGGDHYKHLAIQPMKFSMANGLNACQHTIVKYVTRFRSKGGAEDVKKAKHCIDLLEQLQPLTAPRSQADHSAVHVAAMTYCDRNELNLHQRMVILKITAHPWSPEALASARTSLDWLLAYAEGGEA